MDYKTLGSNIRRIRRMKDLTQEVLAEQAGISTVFLSQIETASGKPSLETVVNIANSLNVTVDTLLSNKAPHDQLKNTMNIDFTTDQLNILMKLFEKRSKKEINALLNAFTILLDVNK
jgi:transcriptional regulator with XRE-family HTH domain